MARAYSLDLRERVAAAVAAGAKPVSNSGLAFGQAVEVAHWGTGWGTDRGGFNLYAVISEPYAEKWSE